MRLIKFRKQSVPFANHFVILLMSRWRAIFATEYVSVSASTPIQYSQANAPLVETRNFKFVCALMVILSLGGV